MINLIDLKATNFLSYKELSFKFRKGLYLIDGYNYDEETSNGSGKSAIIDCVCFALYGDLPRKIKLDEIISWGQPILDVQITFKKDNKHCFIQRTRNPNNINFYIDTECKNGKDIRETQQIINTTLGLGLTTFLRSIYFSQNTDIINQFLFSNDEEKKDVLTELLDLHVFDYCYDDVKKDLKKMEDKITELNRFVASSEKELLDNQQQYIKMKTYAQSFEEMRQNDIKNLEGKIKELSKEKTQVTRKYNKDCEMFKNIEDNKKRVDELIESVDDLAENKLNKLKIDWASNDKELQILNNQLKQFEDLISKGVCPSCKQKVEDKHLVMSIKPLKLKINELECANKDIQCHVSSLGDIVNSNNFKKKEIDDLTIKIIATQNHLTNISANYSQVIAGIEKYSAQYSQMIEQKKKEVNNYWEECEILQKKINELNIIVNSKSHFLKKGEKFISAYNMLIKAFSREGVKAFVFAKIINEINFYVSEYLRDMFDTNILLRFDIESVNSQGVIKQKMDTVLLIDNEKRNINSLSGGEKARLLLAVSFALSRIISSRCSSIPNFICLDECFTGLDKNGREKIMNFLLRLNKEKDFIFVIDHHTEFQNMFDGIYRVEKKNSISQILEN